MFAVRIADCVLVFAGPPSPMGPSALREVEVSVRIVACVDMLG